MRDGNSFSLVCVCFQVILAYESIVLCKCSGKHIDIYFGLKITYPCVINFLTTFEFPLLTGGRISSSMRLCIGNIGKCGSVIILWKLSFTP